MICVPKEVMSMATKSLFKKLGKISKDHPDMRVNKMNYWLLERFAPSLAWSGKWANSDLENACDSYLKNKKRENDSDTKKKSKRKIKTAIYEYDNQVNYEKKEHPFISKISIDDKINPSNKTILKISEPRFEQFNNSKFQKNTLKR